tara:strand:- start:9673 stop:10287 length:615 start_codon:yes stop_codon:yes gene_type:complete
MSEGTVYVLTNPAMPGMVKIGKTIRDVSLRLADLYSTGVPLPFECAYAALVKDVDKTEKAFHAAFEPDRVNPKREFFNINPGQAIAVLELMAIEDVTPKIQNDAKNIDLEALPSIEKFKRMRRPNQDFFEMGLKAGDILKFGRNNETCKVLNARQVSYKGETWHLSNLTKKLVDNTSPLDGYASWYINGRNLQEIYNETYSYYE